MGSILRRGGRVKEVEVEWYYVTCPICGKRIYGMSELQARIRVIDHIKKFHGS